MIDMRCVRTRSLVLTQNGKIGRNLPIEQGHLFEFGAGQVRQSLCVGLSKQRPQAVPVRLPF